MAQQTARTTPGGHWASRLAARAATATALILGLLLPAATHAEPLPMGVPTRLAHAVTVDVSATESDTHVAARAGRHVAEGSAPVPLTEATVERLDATSGPVIVVRASGGGRSYAWVFVERAGSPVLAWTGRLELHGDPGERTADALETTDRTGDGRPDVVVGQVREGVTLCGTGTVLLFPQALDTTGALRPVVLGRVGSDRAEATATADSPGPTPPPVGTRLRMMGASSALGVTDAASLAEPRSLVDGDPATGWVEGRAGGGPGELVVARIDAPGPVRAIALVRSTAAGVTPPRSVFLVGDQGPAVHVQLPETFERAWVTLPEPRAWSCLAVVIEHGSTDDAAEHVGLGEIEAYTALDFGGGLASLVEALVAEGDDAERTADWLARSGPDAVGAVLGAWERLSALGHRRAVRIAAAHASDERALTLLSRAAVDDDAEVRTDAIAVLGRSGSVGARVLVRVAAAEHGEPAAEALALSREAYDVRPLLDAMAAPGGADRPALRAALGARAGRAPHDDVDAAIEAWLASAPVSAVASLALGVSETRGDLARDLVARVASTSAEFADRYRLARAALHATPSRENDAWLEDLATHGDPWILRDAALRALGLRSTAAIAAALADSSPRVRASVVTALAEDPDSTPRLIDRATRDPWPLVRVAALEALAHRPEELPTLRGRIADRSPMVRERAIAILTERADRETWPLLAPIFADDDEWPRVTAAALEYASALCVSDATDAIVLVLRRGTREGAWAPHVDVAVEALRIAIRLGGEAAARARAIAEASASESFAPVLSEQGALPSCPDGG